MSTDKIRVLWFCSVYLNDTGFAGSGPWQSAMAQGLLESGKVELAIVAHGKTAEFTRKDCQQVSQWLVPDPTRLDSSGMPSKSTVDAILNAVREFQPDIVHIWGVESFWGLFSVRYLAGHLVLLEMQGLQKAYAKVFNGGLTLFEQCKCIGLKEVLRSATIWQGRKRFERWGRKEEEIIRGHRFITTQSKWMEAQVKAINGQCQTFHMDLALRAPFLEAGKWEYTSNLNIFCSSAASLSYKGLHVAIRSLAILKQEFPTVVLRIAGGYRHSGIRRDGYIHWLRQLIKQLGLVDNVVWLGALSAEEIIKEMGDSAAMVIPTFIENCCTAMQEAMIVGIPVVCSYAGGVPSLAEDEKSALFFPPGDDVMCAHQIKRILQDQKLAMRLSEEARRVGGSRNDGDDIVQRQVEIYRKILRMKNA